MEMNGRIGGTFRGQIWQDLGTWARVCVCTGIREKGVQRVGEEVMGLLSDISYA